MTWAVSDEGGGILASVGFQIDLISRSAAGVIEVSYKEMGCFLDLVMGLNPNSTRKYFKGLFLSQGIEPRSLFILN
jgi:hypothetical protein